MAINWPKNEAAWTDPGPQGKNLKVNQFLTAHLIRLASAAKGRVTREYLDPAGLSLPEWRLLAALVMFSPMTFADIVSMSTMDKAQISRALRSGQAKGILSTKSIPARQKGLEASPTSGSRIVVTVTPAGRQMYESVIPVAQRYQIGLLDLMTPEERRIMLSVLQRLYQHLEAG